MKKKKTKKKSVIIGRHPTVYQDEFTELEIDFVDALLSNDKKEMIKIYRETEQLIKDVEKDQTLKEAEMDILVVKCDTLLALADRIQKRIIEIQKFQKKMSSVEKKNLEDISGKTHSYIG